MLRQQLLRGAAAGALAIASLHSVRAQEALPVIDIAGSSGAAPSGAARPGPKSNEKGGRLTGYNVTGPVASTKTDIPILQTPYSIQVVPRETMDDRQAVSLTDALSYNMSGITGGTGYYNSAIIRGFRSDSQLFRNGLRQIHTTDYETSNLQSIEVLKGPAAMLYGRVEPGGLINFVPKRPLPTPYFSVQQQAGNFLRSRTMVDATGPLTEDKSVLYRLNASFLRNESYRDFVWNENLMIAPSLTWRPTEEFTLNLDGEYHRYYFLDQGNFPAVGFRPANIPISRYLLDGNLTTKYPNFQERSLFAYDWTYKFEQDWSVTNRLALTTVDYRQRGPDGGRLDEATGTLYRYMWFVPTLHSSDPLFRRESLSTNIDIKGKVVTGPITHKVLAGFEYYDYKSRATGYCCNPVGTINIYNPVYTPSIDRDSLVDNYWNVSYNKWKGIYAQDQFSFFEDRIHVLLGGRHDWASTATGTSWGTSGSFDAAWRGATPVTFSANSPQVGVLLQPLPWLSFYGNYTRSYGASNGVTADSTPLPPQAGRQFEGGAKAELLDGALTATLAYFDIVKSNITRPIPGTRFVQPIGEARSNGVELDVKGRLDENWSVIANYTHLDARITKDQDSSGSGGVTGKRLASVPKNAANLWLKYDASGDFHGLTLGGGVAYRDKQFGDDENTFELPAYARVDAMAAYKFKTDFVPFASDLTFQINVTNLLDTTHYESADGRLYITVGAPRAFIASVRAEF